MQRRKFIKSTALGSMALSLGFMNESAKSHLLTLSFDDGFKKSFYRVAEIHENYGLQACLNVIASGHLPTYKAVDKWIRPELLGNFDDWNALKARGHEIMPHTWKHLNLTKIRLKKAKKNIDKCLDYFEKHLEGYEPSEAVYNFAFNASNTALEDHVLQRTAAVRTGGWLLLEDTRVNLIPTSPQSLRLGCWLNGPDLIDDFIEKEVNKFLDSEGGWLILNLHGLDDEGWGPVSTAYLDRLLKRLVEVDYLEVLPAGEVIKRSA